jgi:hypothetical protein
MLNVIMLNFAYPIIYKFVAYCDIVPYYIVFKF